MKSLSCALSVVTLLGLTFTGCETTGQNTLLGAGTGAAIAAATGHSPLRGAAIGAASGFVVGKVLKHERRRAYEEGYYERHETRYSRGYPVGYRTDRREIVVSPYRPHHEIDVGGIPPGAKVVDPSCNRVFINPW
jgi:osmotically inducible lipoprotein OsmB